MKKKFFALFLVLTASLLLSSCSRRGRTLNGGGYSECSSDGGEWAFEIETIAVGADSYKLVIYPIMAANNEGDYANIYIADSGSGSSEKVKSEVSLYTDKVITISGLTSYDIQAHDSVAIVPWTESETLLEGGSALSTFCELPLP